MRLLFEVELQSGVVTSGVEVQSGVAAAEKLVVVGDQVWAWMIIEAQRHLLAWSCDE